MSLDKRSTDILEELINAPGFVFIKGLTEKLNVSRRTIYYDLDKINSWLLDQELEPVQKSYSKGLYLTEATKTKVFSKVTQMNQNQYFFIKDERLAIIAIHLILSRKAVHLNDLMEKMDVSRVTIYKDLRELNNDFDRYKLRINYIKNIGYHISGEEKDKRKALSSYLVKIMATQHWDQLSERIQMSLNPSLFSPDQPSREDVLFKELNHYYQLLSECEKELNIQLTDEMLRILGLQMFIVCKRLEQNKFIHLDVHEKSVLRQTPEYRVAQQMADKLSLRNNVIFNDDEVCFLTMQLLSSRVTSSTQIEDTTTKEMTALKKTIQNMVLDFQKYACIFFDNQEELERLLFIHLRPAYYRIKYDNDIDNPLTEKIKKEYSDVYLLTKKVVLHLEELLDKQVSEEEVAYLTTYFGGWMKRQGSKPVTRHKAMIVCGTGIGTSMLLKVQLEQLLSTVDIEGTLSIREYENTTAIVDVFFSTVPLASKNHHVIVVNPILTNDDKRNILLKMKTLDGYEETQNHLLASVLDAVHKYTDVINESGLINDLIALLYPKTITPVERRKPMLYELLTKEMIQIHSKVDSWQDAIRLASKPLLLSGYITEEYIQAMIDNVMKLGPYIVIVPNIAIPHARPEQGVKRLGMSMLCLEKAVYFSDGKKHPAQMVIVLAAMDNEAHIKALSQLTTLLADSEKIEQILSATTPEAVARLIAGSKEGEHIKTGKGEM